jgi:hypothetical protein
MVGFIKNMERKNKMIVTGLALVLLIGGIWTVFAMSGMNKAHDEIHLHAGFQLYINDELVDFAQNKYMYFLPCGIPSTEYKNLNDRVHLHDKVGDVVHVHSAGIKWKDLFEAIEYDLPKIENVKFIKDGKEVDNIYEQEIVNNESIIIVYDGKKDVEEYVKNQVSLERIEQIARSKENCGS